MIRCGRRGMVLIFALWTLSILTILAVSVAAGIRQKIILVQHLDERSRMACLLQAAAKKAAGYIHQEMELFSFQYTLGVKAALHGGDWSEITLGADRARISVTDEESKINLNTASQPVLTNLIVRELGMKQEAARKLSDALLDWRQYGESEAKGFFSGDYYANLQYPYVKKDAPYESLEEILLVQGVDQNIYDRLLNVVTIYGDGRVNINTASADVLGALGLPDELVQKILTVRRGKDGIDGTADDHVFLKTFDVATEVNDVIKLDLAEAHAIDAANAEGLLSTNSYYFTIEADGLVAGHAQKAHAIYSSRDDKMVFWQER